ncbi:glutaminase [Novosphingobium sp.]|uniref:glutaminase n=1 Tax=Novosphingobium sp. TaxID=1874826 RepID=UPI0025DB6914|nr:glutaminase [Novosphingobium sp.]
MATVVTKVCLEISEQTDRGVPADYIVPLGRVDPQRFGIAVATADGALHVGGDADVSFSIQSISKVFSLTLALGRIGDQLWNRVGREPSGAAFNSIVQLENDRGVPRNPFVNAGAMVVSDVILAGRRPREAIGEILQFVRSLAESDAIYVDQRVAQAELETAYRNAALANYLRAFGNLTNPVDHLLGVYAHHCAIAMTCRQLALAGRFLMAQGCDPRTQKRVVPAKRARRINALMMTCGHYNQSGEFAYRVGLPGKSGVGGGILAIAPSCASIAVWSPGLNEHGNSVLGTRALESLVRQTGWSVFD